MDCTSSAIEQQARPRHQPLASVDVTVVGAGPVGAFLAYLLAARGLRVVLVDKARLPRVKPFGTLSSAFLAGPGEDPAGRTRLCRCGARPAPVSYCAPSGPLGATWRAPSVCGKPLTLRIPKPLSC